MIELRYHIASLVAVFLALAAGILIGSSMVGSQSVETQIKRLRSGFDRIQAEDRRIAAENEALRQQARVLESALRQVVPAVVQARLTGKRIGIFVNGQGADAALLRETKSLLTAAGATVGSITTFAGNLLPENPASRQALLARTQIAGEDPDRARRQLAALIARVAVRGDEPDLLRFIGRYSPGLSLDGDYSLPVDAVVFFAGDATSEEGQGLSEGTSLQARILDALREAGCPIVACERTDCAVSLMPHFARYSVATVDGVDAPVGKIALVLALAGKQGHYGTKPSAAQLLPDLDADVPATAALPARSLPLAPRVPARPRESPLPGPGHSSHAPANR